MTVAAGSLLATSTTTAQGTRAVVHAPTASFASGARAALVSYLAHGHQTALLVHPAATDVAGTTAEESYNWSGYADSSSTNGEFTKVSGQWTTPSVTCTAEDTITSEWVGLDGWTNDTVEQDGTLDWCYEGTALYYTWYEMYPANTITVGNTLKPGDKITASVVRSGASYTLAVTDATHTANSFSKTESCATTTCLDTSAEWIAERPAFSIGIAPLADFGTWKLTAASETAGGKVGTISSFATNYSISSIDATGQYDLSTVSGLTGAKAFTATWHNSY